MCPRGRWSANNAAVRDHDGLIEFLSKIYSRKIAHEDVVTVIHFSHVTDARDD